MKKALLMLLIIFLPLVTEASSNNNIKKQFQQIRTNALWPVQNSSYDDIISPFGPRWLGRYDWHYGLDITADLNTPVLAPKKSEVYSIIEDVGYGNTLILKHELPKPAKFHDQTIQYYYTWYLHLDSFAENLVEGQTIKKGQVIAYVGQTGNAGSPHLHLEVRAGQVWSQPYNSAGYDPAVNPMFLFAPDKNTMSLALAQQPTSGQRAEIRIVMSDDQPLLNRVKFQIKDTSQKKGKKLIKEYNLNLNQRTGFDASSTDTLDVPDKTKPFFSPVANCFYSNQYFIDVIIPKKYTKKYLDLKYQKTLTVYDIWGRSKKIEL